MHSKAQLPGTQPAFAVYIPEEAWALPSVVDLCYPKDPWQTDTHV